ncbi:PAS domain S-box protein [Bdellovibrio sp. HCB274]|uniref:PAS domain-containing hybrid sensor histidine kinase/response regulator n=1 Tax=Bdellovibrio sp. HCB274 TaxID=3394361 RepID=UPI0039B3B5A4
MTSESNPQFDLQKRYQTLFNSRIMGIIISRLDGEILEANDCFLEMLGYTRADFENKKLNWHRITPPEYMDASVQARQRLVKTGDHVTFEKAYYHREGHLVHVRIGSAFLHGETVITLVQDISIRKGVEKKLEEILATLEERVEARTHQLAESESFLLTIIENMPSMVFVKDAEDLRFVRLNRAGEKLLGISRDEFVGRTDFDFFSKEVAEGFRAVDRKVLSGEVPFVITEDALPTRNGIRFISTIKLAIMDNHGRAQYLLGVTDDITERRELEKQREELVRAQSAKELAEMRARQAQFISDLTFSISHTFDLDEMLKAFTEKMVPLFCDMCTVELIDEEGMDFGTTVVRGLNRAEEDFIREWRIRNPPKWDPESGGPLMIKDRKTIVINDAKHMGRHVDDNFSSESTEFNNEGVELFSEAFMVVPLLARDQKPLGFVTFISTRSRRTFSPSDQALAEEISQRLGVLIENSRLYFRSQDASRAKSDFLANVSHEIRTPLGAMLGFTEILKDDANLSSEQKQTVETILRNGQQLLKIVNEILDISKVESEKIQIEQLRFHLPDLVSDVVHLMRVQAEEKKIELQLVMSNVPEYVVSDPGRLRQILINMVGNAIKFTEEGSVEISVSGTLLGSKTLLQFVIKDTGIGISKENRGNLFQAFSQADSSTTRRYGGTGLGLFLSRKLARLLGGDIYFTSTEGKGSEFTVTVMALQPVYNHATESISEAGDSSQARTQDNLNERVLIVDDASDNRELFKRYLIKAGLSAEQVDMAENGEEALAKACDGCFRLILMDIQMPKMDGLQAIRIMRERGYKGRVVALTAHAMKGDREKCLEAGFDGYLQKPLKREELREILEQQFF